MTRRWGHSENTPEALRKGRGWKKRDRVLNLACELEISQRFTWKHLCDQTIKDRREVQNEGKDGHASVKDVSKQWMEIEGHWPCIDIFIGSIRRGGVVRQGWLTCGSADRMC